LKPQNLEQRARLGIFWLLPADGEIVLLTHDVTPDEAEEYGDCLTSPLSHYRAWEAVRRGKKVIAPLTPATKRLISTHEYEEWPRGRVLYERPAQRFVVYADRQIFAHAALVNAYFGLPEGTPWRTDPHYSRSLPLPKVVL
jgi:hypothetical protein